MSNVEAPSIGTTVEVRDSCLCLHLQRAARAVARRFDTAFRPLGLTSGQFSLLMSLNRPEPPAIGDVARLLAMDRTTLTAALKPLERRGLMRAVGDAADRRIRRLVLTPSGKALLVAALPVWRGEHRRIEDCPDDANRLRAALRSLSVDGKRAHSSRAGAARRPREVSRRSEMEEHRVTGGCLCGAIRYACDGAAGPADDCHRTDCRRCNGSLEVAQGFPGETA
jgi:DNA-binding MarR family transcriptional regulator